MSLNVKQNTYPCLSSLKQRLLYASRDMAHFAADMRGIAHIHLRITQSLFELLMRVLNKLVKWFYVA